MTISRSKFDATKPFFAWVGAADLAFEKLRASAAEAQERDLKAYAAQVGTQLSEAFDQLVEELQGDLGALPKTAQARLEKLPSELKALPKRVESLVEDLQKEARDLPKSAQGRFGKLQSDATALGERIETVVEAQRSTFADLAEEYVEAFEELAVRGRAFVAKLRDDSISGDVEIIDPEAEVVKDVSPSVEKAAAQAAAEAAAEVGAAASAPKPAAKKATTKKAPSA